MTLDEMVRIAPVHVTFRNGDFLAVWSPRIANVVTNCPGLAATSYLAVARAYNEAKRLGWEP